MQKIEARNAYVVPTIARLVEKETSVAEMQFYPAGSKTR